MVFALYIVLGAAAGVLALFFGQSINQTYLGAF